MITSYGVQLDKSASPHGKAIEQLKLRGYTVLENVLSKEECEAGIKSLDKIYQAQETEFGHEQLAKIQELDTARAPFLHDEFFIRKIILNEKLLPVLESTIDGPFQMHLQNGIINRPNKVHHQTSWHRDLPYQNWVCTKPLSMSALFCLSNFTDVTGATWVVPYSHLFENPPTLEFIEENKIQVHAPAGSVIVFNSMILHGAGINKSANNRIGINCMYTIPLIKQQIDVSESLKGLAQFSEKEKVILGVKYAPPKSVKEWRTSRISRASAK